MAMFVLIVAVVIVISTRVYGSLPITDHEYLLMHYTKHINEGHFAAGRPKMIIMPLVGEDSCSKKFGYLIEELHKSGRWPIQVYNVSLKMKGNMYAEIHPHYIILISGLCKKWEKYISGVWQQLFELPVNDIG